MNEMPPSFARATAILSSETACMIADTIGIFKEIAGSSPLLYFTKGVFNETLSGMQSGPV